MSDKRNRFDITWRNGAYYVSIHSYDGGTVVTADYHDKVIENLSTLLRVAGLPQHFIDGAIKEAENKV
jgi:hypothetical protein